MARTAMLLLVCMMPVLARAQCPMLPAIATLPPNGLAQLPPMGWNSWYAYSDRVSDAIIRSTADAMVSSGMQAAGYQYITIDDAWQGVRDGNGNIRPKTGKFPDMKALTDYMHSKGLKAGIYSSPGNQTCGGAPGSFLHEVQDANQYAAWGYDFFKYDWCSAAASYASCPYTPRQVWQMMAQSLRATGRDIVYSIAAFGNYTDIGKAAGGNMTRTSQDVGTASWKDWSYYSFNYVGPADMNGPGYWNDPDMLPVGHAMTTDEDKTAFSLYSLRGAPLFASIDLSTMSTTTRDILTNTDVIAVDQDALGVQGAPVSVVGTAQVWAKRMSDGWAVGLFNLGAEPAVVTANWSMFGQTTGFCARDLWAKRNLGYVATGHATLLPPHGVVVLKLTHASRSPRTPDDPALVDTRVRERILPRGCL